ncbi:MAG: acyl-CoA thioesterase [Paracoccus hibiscisoli]|uniref:acyl-CoA thioesterase n=1 Tax=Paracoccus hibiscisoli TaxID=2023261 RepID=UPI003918DE69
MPGRSAYPVFQTIPTRWRDNDQYGHIYNATYLELFDEAMTLTLLGQGFLAPDAPLLVVVENGCRYLAELSWPATLQIGVAVTHLGRSSARFDMGMFDGAAPSPAALAHFVTVTLDRDTRRPVPIPDGQRAFLETLR